MKTETFVKIAIASALCAPACSVAEQGVVVYKQELPEENALYVNLIRKNKSKQKPLRDLSNEIFDADRKLFFADSTYTELFDYIVPGDTISFRNSARATYIDIDKENRICRINGARVGNIIKSMRKSAENQR